MRKIPTIERKPLTIRHVHHPLESTTAFAAVFTTDALLPDVFRLVGPLAHAQCDTSRKRVDLGFKKKEKKTWILLVEVRFPVSTHRSTFKKNLMALYCTKQCILCSFVLHAFSV